MRKWNWTIQVTTKERREVQIVTKGLRLDKTLIESSSKAHTERHLELNAACLKYQTFNYLELLGFFIWNF